jgi:hypothetical protein
MLTHFLVPGSSNVKLYLLGVGRHSSGQRRRHYRQVARTPRSGKILPSQYFAEARGRLDYGQGRRRLSQRFFSRSRPRCRRQQVSSLVEQADGLGRRLQTRDRSQRLWYLSDQRLYRRCQ